MRRGEEIISSSSCVRFFLFWYLVGLEKPVLQVAKVEGEVQKATYEWFPIKFFSSQCSKRTSSRCLFLEDNKGLTSHLSRFKSNDIDAVYSRGWVSG